MNVWLRTNTKQHIDISFLLKTIFSELIVSVTVTLRLKMHFIFILIYIHFWASLEFLPTTWELCNSRVDMDLPAATVIVLRNTTKSNKKHVFLSVSLQRISFQLKRNKCLLIQSSYLLWNVYRNIPRKCKILFSMTYKGKPVKNNCKNKALNEYNILFHNKYIHE
jgi:hypothetical protein